MPRLCGVGSRCVGACFRFHVHVVAVNERYLIVSQQVAVVERLLVWYERVVHNICQNLIKFLAVDVKKARVLRVLSPLGPARALLLC